MYGRFTAPVLGSKKLAQLCLWWQAFERPAQSVTRGRWLAGPLAYILSKLAETRSHSAGWDLREIEGRVNRPQHLCLDLTERVGVRHWDGHDAEVVVHPLGEGSFVDARPAVGVVQRRTEAKSEG